MKKICRSSFFRAILQGFLSGDIGSRDPGQMLGSKWKCIIATVSEGNSQNESTGAPIRRSSCEICVLLLSHSACGLATLSARSITDNDNVVSNLPTNFRHDCTRSSLVDPALAPQPPVRSGFSGRSIVSDPTSYRGEGYLLLGRLGSPKLPRSDSPHGVALSGHVT
jgi:hypothetical protein